MRSFTIVLAGSARCSTSSPFYPVRSHLRRPCRARL